MQLIITITAGLLAIIGFYWAFVEQKKEETKSLF